MKKGTDPLLAWKISGSGSGSLIEKYFLYCGLALVKDNVDPSLSAISVGNVGTSIDGSVTRFSPASFGILNRDFSQVTADGQSYCYGSNSAILIELLDFNTLRFEVFDGQNCGSLSFTSNALTFIR